MDQGAGKMVLVTGGTGAIGPSVVRALLATGHDVRTLALDPPMPETLPSPVSVVIGDVSDPKAVRAAMHGVSLVIHMAALLHAFDSLPHMRQEYEKINVGGTATVVENAVAVGVERIVFFSTISVYGHSGARVLTEDSPVHPDSLYAQTKLDAEKLVLGARRLDGLSLGTVLRLAAVYGPGVKGNYRRLVESLARRRFIPVGDGRNRRTLIFDRDAAKAALLAAFHPAAAGRTYNVTDGRCHAMEDIIRTVCDALGRKAPRFSLPERPVRWTAGLLEDLTRLAGFKSPIGRAVLDKYMEDLAVSGERIQQELGFSPEFNLAEGWAETILKMRQMGEL
jgi:nucleoside-diphosphate-sugar epimerase